MIAGIAIIAKISNQHSARLTAASCWLLAASQKRIIVRQISDLLECGDTFSVKQ
jgi:hypothetical protein